MQLSATHRGAALAGCAAIALAASGSRVRLSKLVVDATLKPSFVRALNAELSTSVPTTGLRAELELHVSTNE